MPFPSLGREKAERRETQGGRNGEIDLERRRRKPKPREAGRETVERK